MNIAAASVLAKTHRDEIMRILSADFPTYNWRKNKSYPTKEHRLALLKEGKCLHHRTSFQLIPKQINLNL
jgi:ribonuclease HII